jgi:chaperonin GroEL
MAKEILYDIEAKTKLVSGIVKLTEVVKVTMGPKGRYVALGQNNHSPHITRDGVTVARTIVLPDHMENIGAQLVKEVASRTAEEAGDGTTTATVLACAIFCRSLKYVTAGANDGQVRIGIEQGMKAVINELKKMSIPVNTPEQIRQVAALSANQDDKIGDLVTKAIGKVGKDGIITVDEASGTTSSLTFTEGAKIESGYLSHHFVTDVTKSVASLENPLIFVTDQKIQGLAEILPLLEKVVEAGKPILIIADAVENEALTALVVNHTRGAIKIAVIKAPGFGDQRREALEDLALLTGATFVSEAAGHKLNKVQTDHLGTATKVIIDKDSTTFIEGAGNKSEVQKKVAELKAQNKNTDKFESEKLSKRIALLTGSVAQINLAAHTESEMIEIKDRVDDSLQATRAAIEEGIVPGGGVALLRSSGILDTLTAHNEDQRAGFKILKVSLEEPALTIARNAGAESFVIVEKILKGKDDFGFNAATGQFDRLISAGIVDPLKVVRLALEHAVSIAGMMLTTYCLIAEEQQRKEEKSQPVHA